MEDAPAAAVDSPAVDDDIAMAEAGDAQGVAEDAKSADESAQPVREGNDTTTAEVKQEEKQEVKLEDLFDGIDSDDDFPIPGDSPVQEEPE